MPRRPAPLQLPPDLGRLLAADIPRDRAELAVRLGTLRWLRGWNWRQLGEEAGVHPRQVEEIEAGVRDPSFSTLIKLARALGLHSLDELVVELPLTVPTA